MTHRFIFTKARSLSATLTFFSLIPLLFAGLNYRHGDQLLAGLFFIPCLVLLGFAFAKKTVLITPAISCVEACTTLFGINFLKKRVSIAPTTDLTLEAISVDTSSMQNSKWLEMSLTTAANQTDPVQWLRISEHSPTNKQKLATLAEQIADTFDLTLTTK